MLLLLACNAPEPKSTADDTATLDSDSPPPTGDAVDDPIPLTGDETADTIDPEGDVDYWAIELEEGDFVLARTVTVEGDPADPDFDCDGRYDDNPLDTVLLVHDPSGAQVMTSDDQIGTDCGFDSLGLVRADQAGTWVIGVTDWNNWEDGGVAFGNPPVGGPEYTYRLFTTSGTAEAGGGALPDEDVVATLDDGEADAWTFTLATRAWVTLENPGGSTAGVEDMVFTLSDAEGELAYVDSDAFFGSRWGLGMIAPLEPGDYIFTVSDTDGEVAIDDWYWLRWSTDEESAQNPEIEPNDTLDVGTPLVTRDGEGEYEGDYVQAELDGWITAGDVDIFIVPVEDGQYLYVTLYAAQVGSRLDPLLDLVDVDGVTVLASADGDTYTISREQPGASGTISLAISGADTKSAGYYLVDLQVWDSRRPW